MCTERPTAVRAALTALLGCLALVLGVVLTLGVALGLAGGASAADEGGTGGAGESTCTTSPAATESTDGTDPEGDDDPDGGHGDEAGTSCDPSETGDPSDTASTDVPDGAFDVDDASLRWGINNESNNRAFAPGTFNFMSAGKVGNPGSGGATLTNASAGALWSTGAAAGWKQQDGDVSIEKYVNGAYAPATWAGLMTDSADRPLGAAAAGTFSNHQVVLAGGTGTVDPTAGTAEIHWTGSFTVIYYSGYSFFYVTDPVLKVTDGQGVLTATMSGYASSMDDLTQWSAVPAATATLADLGSVDLHEDLGFIVKPAYGGVVTTVPAGSAAQVRDGANWGSFPQTFINFLGSVGTAAYWYSSGGTNDAFKPGLPLTVSYAAKSPVLPPAPQTSAAADVIRNPIVHPPTPSATVTVTAPAAAPLPLSAAPGVGAVAAALPSAHPVDTLLALTAAETTPPSADPLRWPWGAGALALLLAAALVVGSFRPRRESRNNP